LLKRGLSCALAVILTVGTFFGFGWNAPESAHAVAGDIVAASSLQTGDIIYYGNYPQTDLGKVGNVDAPVDVDYVTADYTAYGQSSDGNHYFKIEPIAWRVLENDDDKLFLLADKAIDNKKYNETNTSITWEKCTARSWLNGYAASENNDSENYSVAGSNLIGNAFSAAEQAKIPSTLITNPNSIIYGTPGGDDTTDKIFYLKEADMTNASYGFTDNNSRKAQPTDYAVAMGAQVISESNFWWLRSPCDNITSVVYVYSDGVLHPRSVTTADVAVRPAFYLETPGVIFRETGTPDEYQASIPSTDATLSNLSVSPGTLSPAFASATTEYNVEVPNAVNSITLTATKADANATVSGDVGAKSLSVGPNTFTITVTAEDGNTEKTYTITVTRDPDKTALKSAIDAANSVKNANKTQGYTDSDDFTAMLNALATGENVYANAKLQSEADAAATAIRDALAILGYGKVVNYGFEGGDSDYTKGSDAGLKHRTEKDLGLHNAVVTVDGARITDGEDYTAVHGSTVVQLKTAYLDTLGVGKHKLVVEFVDGKNSESEFTILAADSYVDDDSDDEDDDDDDDDDSDAVGENENNDDSGITSQPKTGDDISALWLVSLLASAALISLLMVLFIRRKARME
jgi:LPXTG-motif cell wall-anchored protein